MKTKKSTVRNRPKGLSSCPSRKRKDRVRLAIECTAEQRKYIKTLAALNMLSAQSRTYQIKKQLMH